MSRIPLGAKFVSQPLAASCLVCKSLRACRRSVRLEKDERMIKGPPANSQPPRDRAEVKDIQIVRLL